MSLTLFFYISGSSLIVLSASLFFQDVTAVSDTTVDSFLLGGLGLIGLGAFLDVYSYFCPSSLNNVSGVLDSSEILSVVVTENLEVSSFFSLSIIFLLFLSFFLVFAPLLWVLGFIVYCSQFYSYLCIQLSILSYSVFFIISVYVFFLIILFGFIVFFL